MTWEKSRVIFFFLFISLFTKLGIGLKKKIINSKRIQVRILTFRKENNEGREVNDKRKPYKTQGISKMSRNVKGIDLEIVL